MYRRYETLTVVMIHGPTSVGLVNAPRLVITDLSQRISIIKQPLQRSYYNQTYLIKA